MYNLRRIGKPRINRKGNISFGGLLAWDWYDLRKTNSISMIIEGDDGAFSNFVPEEDLVAG